VGIFSPCALLEMVLNTSSNFLSIIPTCYFVSSPLNCTWLKVISSVLFTSLVKCNLVASAWALDWVPCMTLICILYNALVGILASSKSRLSTSFNGLYVVSSSTCNILWVIQTFSFPIAMICTVSNSGSILS
jgi:hypothetical protein